MDKLKEGIYKITIPFENIYTSSFILTNGTDAIILDSGSTDYDALTYIIPDVLRLGVIPKYLVSTHTHGDHHGGINALKSTYPDAKIALFSESINGARHLTDGELLLERFKMLNLPGHSCDSLGVLDIKTNTLLSGDSLQLFGVGSYGTSVCDFKAYYNTIDRARKIKPDTIIASHEYVPLGFMAEGQEILTYLEECEKAAKALQVFSKKYKGIDHKVLEKLHNDTNPALPPVNYMTIKAAQDL